MANLPVAQRQTAAQSFVVFDQLPEGCLLFQVPDDRCEPIFIDGELVVIDPRDSAPEFGSLFLCKYKSAVTQSIVEMVPSPRGSVMLVSPRRPQSVEEILACAERGFIPALGDGPYELEGPHAWYLGSIIQGKVIGLYSPADGAGAFAKLVDRRTTPFSHPEEFVLVPL